MLQKTSSGGDKVIQCLEREGVEVIYGYSGGAAMPIFDALVDSKIKFVLVRHEQGATHMADGYARATGKPGVVLVTSGPGATNCVTDLLTALMDSVPMIVLTGQTITPMLGKDAFQEADVTGITYPVVKHSYLVKNAADIPRVMKEAFHIATTGRPGPVLIDLPKDITQAWGWRSRRSPSGSQRSSITTSRAAASSLRASGPMGRRFAAACERARSSRRSTTGRSTPSRSSRR
jgi:acetolactate synthase-1/2/3 large subunit